MPISKISVKTLRSLYRNIIIFIVTVHKLIQIEESLVITKLHVRVTH